VIDLLLLDRDGVINERIIDGYVTDETQLIFIDSTFDFLRQNQSSIKNIGVVTNQQGIGKKLFSASDLFRIHERVSQQFSNYGLVTPAYFVCPHLSGSCECRKPKPLLLLNAMEHFKVTKESTLMIGDSISDVLAAKKAGVSVVHLGERCKSACGAISHRLNKEIFGTK